MMAPRREPEFLVITPSESTLLSIRKCTEVVCSPRPRNLSFVAVHCVVFAYNVVSLGSLAYNSISVSVSIASYHFQVHCSVLYCFHNYLLGHPTFLYSFYHTSSSSARKIVKIMKFSLALYCHIPGAK